MKVAYLILAHNNPRHLQRLLGALFSNSSAFFIHIDRKSTLTDFLNINGENVQVSEERIPVYWGDFSMVEATLILLRMSLADQRRFDYFVLLSGTDYPLHPVSYIESFLNSHKGKEFINIVRMPCEAAGKPFYRLTTYQPSPGESKIARGMRNLLVTARIIPKVRDYNSHFPHLVPHGGCEWWALSREACEYVQSFVVNESDVVNFFRNTVCPDESFFQTILGNSPYKARTRRNLMYTDWTGGGAHPAYLTEKHIDLFKATPSITLDDIYGAGEILFARKFSDEAEEIVRQLDQLIGERGLKAARR